MPLELFDVRKLLLPLRAEQGVLLQALLVLDDAHRHAESRAEPGRFSRVELFKYFSTQVLRHTITIVGDRVFYVFLTRR